MKNIVKGLLGILLLVSSSAWADQVPGKSKYEGEYYIGNTVPASAKKYSMVFRLFDAPSGGNQVWQEKHDDDNSNPVDVKQGGKFSVVLGTDMLPFPDCSKNYWLVAKDYGGDKLIDTSDDITVVNRQQLLSAPYAKYTDHAIHADDGVPVGAVFMWLSTTPIPPDYEEVIELQGRFPRGKLPAEDVRSVGGAVSHYHNASGGTSSFNNTDTVLPPPPSWPGPTEEVGSGGHSHSFNVNTNSADNLPPYENIIFIRKFR